MAVIPERSGVREAPAAQNGHPQTRETRRKFPFSGWRLRRDHQQAETIFDGTLPAQPTGIARRQLFTLNLVGREKPTTEHDAPEPTPDRERRRDTAAPLPDLITPEFSARTALVKAFLASVGISVALSHETQLPDTHPLANITVAWGSHALPWTPSWLHPNETQIEAASQKGDLTASDWPAGTNAIIVDGMRKEKAKGNNVVLLVLDSDNSLTGTTNYAWIPHLPLSQQAEFPKYIVSLETEIPSDFDISSINFESPNKGIRKQVDQLAGDLQYRYNYSTKNAIELELERSAALEGTGLTEGVIAGSLIGLTIQALSTNPMLDRRKLIKRTAIGVGAVELTKIVNEQGWLGSILLGEAPNQGIQRALVELQSLTDHPVYGNYLDLMTQARTAMAIQLLIDTQRAFPQMYQGLDIPADTKGIQDPHGFAMWGSIHSDARLSDEGYREGVIKAFAQNVLGYIDWSLRTKYQHLMPYRESLMANAVASFTSPGASLLEYPWGSPEHIKGTPKRVIREQILDSLSPKLIHIIEETSQRPFNVVLQEAVDNLYQQSLQTRIDAVTYNLEGSSVGIPDQSVGRWVREIAEQDFGLTHLQDTTDTPPTQSQSTPTRHYASQLDH